MKRFYWAERVSFNLISIIIFTLILLPFFFQSCSADEINYQEDLSFGGFQIIQYATYDDGTILLRIRPGTDESCKASSLYFRLIRTDGTISKITLNNTLYNIPKNNYCFVNNEIAFTLRPIMPSNPTAKMSLTWISGYKFPVNLISDPPDDIRIYGIATNYILISYLCGDSYNNVCGLLMDWDGNVLNSGIDLGSNCDDVNIAQNINSNIGGFIWVCYMKSTSQLIWRRFSTPDSSGTLSNLGVGRINDITKFSPNYTSIFPLEDGGYGIVTAQYNTTNLTTQGTAFIPPWTVFVYFISDDGIKGPFQLYEQTTQSLNQLKIFSCSISFQSSGYNCIIYEVLVGATVPAFITIDFFRSGARKISQEFTVAGLETYQYVVWDILNLYRGGYCVLRQGINTTAIDGLVYDDFGNPNGTWGLPSNYTYTRNIGVYPNNTLWAVVNGPDNFTWTFVTSSSLVNFRTVPDPGGFGNAFISGVSPGNSSIIPLSSTPNLTITFTTNISLSSGNVSIYESNGSFPILRQTFRGTDNRFVRLLNGTNGSTQVQFDVLNTTFNQRSSDYFIQVDNAFVRDIQFNQPLLGIRPSIWFIRTDNVDIFNDTAPESAIVRLTPEGSTYFRTLSDSNRSKFAVVMTQGLSTVIPCDKSRIQTTSNFQLDENKQVLLRIDVKNYVNSSKERVPTKVLKDLDSLIKNRDITGVSHEFATSMLDPSYGSQFTQDLWSNYKFLLWILLVIVGILSILVCLSIMRHRKGKHCAVFMFTFLAIDFVLDILFVITHGQDLYWLYPVSVIFITIPIIVNSGFTFMLISREIMRNKKFSAWWFRSSKTALLFTILAGADIDVLNILSSECGRLEELSAPFSVYAMERIRIFNVISMLIEDLPQLIVLTLYHIYSIVPSIIPIITLSSSCIIMLFKIACLIYSSMLLKQRKKAEPDRSTVKSESPYTGNSSTTTRSDGIRDEYLDEKDGITIVSFPRNDDELPIQKVPSGRVAESIVNGGTAGELGEIGETLKKGPTLPEHITSLSPKNSASKLLAFISGGGKSKKGTTSPKEEAGKGKSTEPEEGGKDNDEDDDDYNFNV